MRFSITPNPFNTEILGKKSGRLIYGGNITDPAVRQYLKSAQREGYRFLDVLPKEEERQTAEALIRGGFDLVGLLVELSRRLDKGPISKPKIPCHLYEEKDRADVLRTASAEFVDDRYSQDPNVPPAVAGEIFLRWMENSIAGRSDFIYAYKGAFCACFVRKDDGAGVIDLVAVPKKLQGRGVGVSLVLASIAEFKRRGCNRTIVKTAGTNVGALKTYGVCGYVPSILYYSLHWHAH